MARLRKESKEYQDLLNMIVNKYHINSANIQDIKKRQNGEIVVKTTNQGKIILNQKGKKECKSKYDDKKNQFRLFIVDNRSIIIYQLNKLLKDDLRIKEIQDIAITTKSKAQLTVKIYNNSTVKFSIDSDKFKENLNVNNFISAVLKRINNLETFNEDEIKNKLILNKLNELKESLSKLISDELNQKIQISFWEKYICLHFLNYDVKTTISMSNFKWINYFELIYENVGDVYKIPVDLKLKTSINKLVDYIVRRLKDMNQISINDISNFKEVENLEKMTVDKYNQSVDNILSGYEMYSEKLTYRFYLNENYLYAENRFLTIQYRSNKDYDIEIKDEYKFILSDEYQQAKNYMKKVINYHNFKMDYYGRGLLNGFCHFEVTKDDWIETYEFDIEYPYNESEKTIDFWLEEIKTELYKNLNKIELQYQQEFEDFQEIYNEYNQDFLMRDLIYIVKNDGIFLNENNLISFVIGEKTIEQCGFLAFEDFVPYHVFTRDEVERKLNYFIQQHIFTENWYNFGVISVSPRKADYLLQDVLVDREIINEKIEKNLLLTDAEAEYIFNETKNKDTFTIKDYIILLKLIDSKGFFDRYESQLESIFINYPEPILKLIKMKLDKETDQFKAKFMKKILNHSNNIK